MKTSPSMHENSIAAFDENDRELIFSNREREIIAAFEDIGAETDRSILAYLRYTDMNAVRPRITELINKGVLREVGSVICPVTKKRVRVCKIAPRNNGDYLPGFNPGGHRDDG